MEPKYIYNITDQIEKKISNLSIKQILQLSWVCCVETLPFIGNGKSFIKENRIHKQDFIADIFYSLDLITYAFIKYDGVTLLAPNKTTEYYKAEKYKKDITIEYYEMESLKIAVKLNKELEYACRASTVFYGKTIANALYLIHYVLDFNRVYFSNNPLKQAKSHIKKSIMEIVKNAINAYLTSVDDSANLNEFIIEYIYSLNKKITFRKNYIDTNSTLWLNFVHILENEKCENFAYIYKELYEDKSNIDIDFLTKRLSVPNEIRNMGAAHYSNYIKKIRHQEIVHFNEARVIILGDKGAGKTSLARKLINPNAKMPEDSESTAGIDTSIWALKEDSLYIHIWDFAGHVVTHAVHQCFLSERCLYILVYDGRTEERRRLDYWLNHVENYGGNSDVIILINIKDENQVRLPENYLTERENIHIKNISRFSIKNDKKELEKFRGTIRECIMNNPSWNTNKIPLNYYNIKEKLQSLFAKNDTQYRVEYITRQEFDTISEKYHVSNTDELLTDLHTLGIALRYNCLKTNNTLILNPEWISWGIYKIINWANNNNKYSVSILEFKKVFENEASRYPNDKYEFLFELMNYYELAYKFKDSKTLIIPHLLNEDRPAKLPEFSLHESLYLKYNASQELPLNTISRFIVRYNQLIKKEKGEYLVWKYGVVLEENNTIALIREDDRVISISVKGRFKTMFIGRIRNTFNEIFATYKSAQPELFYSLTRLVDIPESWLSERKILNYKRNNLPYFDDESNRYININEIIDKYDIDPSGTLRSTVIIAGNNSNVIFTQGDPTFTQYLREEINRLALEISQITSSIPNKEDMEDIQIQLSAIYSQVKKNNPKIDILKNSFEIINNILSGIAANEIGPSVVAGIKNVIQTLGNVLSL